MQKTDLNLGVAVTRPGVSGYVEPWVVPDARTIPPLRFRGLRPGAPIEGNFLFTSTAAVKIIDICPQLRSRRYCQQVWFYGVASMTGDPSTPVPNVNPAAWGYNPSTLLNQISPWAGTFGQLIQPADGMIIDLYTIYVAGTVNDGLYITGL